MADAVDGEGSKLGQGSGLYIAAHAELNMPHANNDFCRHLGDVI